MTIGEWDPRGSTELLDNDLLQRMADFDLELVAPLLGLNEDEVKKFAAIMHIKAAEWLAVCENRDSESLVALCKWLTLAEEQLEGWLAGDKSPVIVIAKLLRLRGDYPQELTAWIKEHSTNRFLPYGSLLDRL